MGTKVTVPVQEWKTPVWSALDFNFVDPTRYSVRFDDNELTGNAAFGQVIVQGDLDADGVYSLYGRTCSPSGGSPLFSINELE